MNTTVILEHSFEAGRVDQEILSSIIILRDMFRDGMGGSRDASTASGSLVRRASGECRTIVPD
jgi:hypothetical protein